MTVTIAQTDADKGLSKFINDLVELNGGQTLRNLLSYEHSLTDQLINKIDKVSESKGFAVGMGVLLHTIIKMLGNAGLEIIGAIGEEKQIYKNDDLLSYEFVGKGFTDEEQKIVKIIEVGIKYKNNILLKPIVIKKHEVLQQ
jgi:hypothetical protein